MNGIGRAICLSALLLSGSVCSFGQGKQDSWIRDSAGVVVRGDLAHKQIALIFAGDSIADDVHKIGAILKKNQVQASFFLTGNFYQNPDNQAIVKMLVKDGHYLGPHADTNLKYIDPSKPDSLGITFEHFKRDLHDNFKHLSAYGIKKEGARFFLAPGESYNKSIVNWSAALNLQLINGSPGALEHLTQRSDEAYKSSEEIYRSIMEHEHNDHFGLNGAILVFDIASSGDDHDQFHQYLDRLIQELDHRGYSFVQINELLD